MLLLFKSCLTVSFKLKELVVCEITKVIQKSSSSITQVDCRKLFCTVEICVHASSNCTYIKIAFSTAPRLCVPVFVPELNHLEIS